MWLLENHTTIILLYQNHLPPRIALAILNLVGTSPALIMLGFMACSMFLSMWISNTACTAMMVVFLQDCVEPFPFYLKPRHIIVYQVPIVDAISLAISSTNHYHYHYHHYHYYYHYHYHYQVPIVDAISLAISSSNRDQELEEVERAQR